LTPYVRYGILIRRARQTCRIVNGKSDISASAEMDKILSEGNEGIIKDIELQSMLYDFYGSLLNDNQRQVMALYHEDNLSLSEISAELGMTRQAVHYTLKKAENALRDYESKLGLVDTYETNRRLAETAIRKISESSLCEEDKAEITEILRRLSD